MGYFRQMDLDVEREMIQRCRAGESDAWDELFAEKLYAIKTDSKGLAKSPWPMFGRIAQHTGRAPKK